MPVNHTNISPVVRRAFAQTRDVVKGRILEDISYILDSGVEAVLVYGDQVRIESELPQTFTGSSLTSSDKKNSSNWIHGERSSLSLNHSHSESFSRAGYTLLCKTLCGSAKLAADPAIFCLNHRQLHAEDVSRYINLKSHSSKYLLH